MKQFCFTTVLHQVQQLGIKNKSTLILMYD